METLGGVSAMSHYHSNNHTETSKFTLKNNAFSIMQSNCVICNKTVFVL